LLCLVVVQGKESWLPHPVYELRIKVKETHKMVPNVARQAVCE